MIICKSITILGDTGKRYSFGVYPNTIKDISMQAIGVFMIVENHQYKPLSVADLYDYGKEAPEYQQATHLAILIEAKCTERSKILTDIDTVLKRAC